MLYIFIPKYIKYVNFSNEKKRMFIKLSYNISILLRHNLCIIFIMKKFQAILEIHIHD